METDAALRIVDPSSVVVDRAAPRLRRGTLPAEAIVYVDRHVVVVDKPSGVSTVPFEEGEKDTLVDLVRAALRRTGGGFDPMLGVVHRLDKETTGLLVFARTLAAKRHLEAQMRAHTAERVYVALAHGVVPRATHRTWLLEDRGDGLRGSWGVFRTARGPRPADAREAITHVTPLEVRGDVTLCECRLETGRQHQIRIHMSESGHMLVGERVYVREHRGPRVAAPHLMLHSRRLTFVHPDTDAPVTFERPPPWGQDRPT
ncbi:MAG: RluA family pseudouridine synthase [Deltaproteobacteria bacterium]|nr:RluA family pseudouridine synthase [Deltaproteobacteria bacterium]